jgi:hypothetical protein
MATPTIDVSFLGYFSPIFVFVLIFVTVYALLQFTKMLGENKILHALIAVFISILFLFSGGATTVVLFMAPWFTVFFIFLLFLLMSYKLFGASDQQVKNVITNSKAVQYSVFAVAIIIGLFGLGFGFGQELLGYSGTTTDTVDALDDLGDGSTATGDFQQNLAATLFNPRILGMVMILVIASLTIRAMSAPLRPEWPHS